jgi:hypothetical protein
MVDVNAVVRRSFSQRRKLAHGRGKGFLSATRRENLVTGEHAGVDLCVRESWRDMRWP